MNILITAAASATSYRLQREIGEGAFIFADCVDLPQLMLQNRRFLKIPDAANQPFSHLLLTACLDLNIEKVFPLKRAEIIALAEARQLFDEYGIKVIVPLMADLEALLLSKPSQGAILIKEGPGEQNDFIKADRGVFQFNADQSEVQLLSID